MSLATSWAVDREALASAPGEPTPFDDGATGTLADHAALLRQAAGSGEPSRLLRVLDSALNARRLDCTRAANMCTSESVSAALNFTSAFVAALHALGAAPADIVTARRRDRLIAAARTQAGRSALMLSGGGALGNHHLGVLRILVQEGLLPEIISGASAGAMFAAVVGTRTDEDLERLIRDGVSAFSSASGAQRLDGVGLRRMIDRLIPDLTFGEAYALSGRVINIVVSAQRGDGKGLILSRKTSPDVLIRAAVQASCSVPLLFPAVALEVRDATGEVEPFRSGERWIDGSIFADLPSSDLRTLYGVDRCIASMVNPLVLPFVTHPQEHGAVQHWLAGLGKDVMKTAVGHGLEWLIPMVENWPNAALALETWQRVVGQDYRADITITPRQRYYNPQRLTDLVGEETLRSYVREGERSTLAQTDAIRAVIGVEQALRRFA